MNPPHVYPCSPSWTLIPPPSPYPPSGPAQYTSPKHPALCIEPGLATRLIHDIWNSNTLATWWEELIHLKRPWCWERLRAGGEGDDRRWDGWMASPTQWTWVWVDSSSWWWTERPGVLQFMGLQRVRHNWATELTFYMVQFSHPHKTAGKTIALTIQTFASKVSLFFNMPSRLVITFFPRSKCLVIS